MNCEEFKEKALQLVYGELTAPEEADATEHLQQCPDCRAAHGQLEGFHRLLAARARPEPSPALLAECRMRLADALERERGGWRAWRVYFARLLRLEPSGALAVGLSLLVCGFGLGWGLRPHAGMLVSGPAGINSPTVAGQDLAGMQISGISDIASDPNTGGVKITLDAARRVTLEGALDDPRIRQVLVYALKDYSNPGIRRDTLDALRAHTDQPQVRQALLYALAHDPNPGVRLEVLKAVEDMPGSDDVDSALLHSLEHDVNTGVRVAAVDALTGPRGRLSVDDSVAKTLRRLAEQDRNPYVRLKCASAVLGGEE